MDSSTSLLSAKTSSMTTRALVCAVIAVVVAMAMRSLRRRLLLPPGPWFLGVKMIYYMVRMRLPDRLEKLYEATSREYGKIFSFSIGRDVQVVINDPEIIREAFVKQREAFNDRRCPSAYAKGLGGEHQHRILFGNGRLWKTTRRVVTPCLRNIGTWGEQMEMIILQEADRLNDKLAEHGAKSIDPRAHITKAVANVIHTMVHGYNLEYDDGRLQVIIDSFKTIVTHPLASNDVIRYFPFLFHLPLARPLRRAYKLLETMLSNAVRTQTGGTVCNRINTLTKRIIKAAEEDEAEDGLKAKEVWRVIYDLMLAGSDTTANTLQWAVLTMAYYPQIQKRILDEIRSVIGDSNPCIKDQKSLPYIQATIMEILRFRPVIPLGVPHITSATTALKGYTIPKGAVITANISSCHHNPEYWDDPEVFNPGRFLTDDGQSLGKEPQAFMPFSFGPRRCAGEQLAKNELFLIFTKIIQRFDIDFAPGDGPESFDEGDVSGAGILRPNAMKVRFRPRNICNNEE